MSEFTHSKIKILYRCEVDAFGFGESENGIGFLQFSPDLKYREFPVIGYTPKGFKIEGYDGKIKFVLRDNGKRFAHESKQWAYESKMKRTQRRLKILKNEINICKKHIEILQQNKPE